MRGGLLVRLIAHVSQDALQGLARCVCACVCVCGGGGGIV